MPAQSQAKRRSAPQPEEKPAKRTRISRACDQCRLAREKCDGVQPACFTCSGASRQCSYTANPKKRGIQPGYIRTLELALAWLFQQNAENEVALNEKLAKEGASSLLLSRDSKESNKLHRRWRKAKFYTNVDKQLSGGETSRHEQPDYLSHSSDEASDVEEAPVTNVGHHRGRSEHEPSVAISGQHPTPQVYSTTRPSTVMPADSYKLLEVYFTHIQSWLPICEKHDVLRSSYSYPPQGLPAISEQPDSSSYAELWSILAVASLCDTSTNSESSLSTPEMAAKSYENAKSMIPCEVGHFEAGHIKALLNLAVFNMAQLKPAAAWLLIGFASRALEVMDQPTLLANPRHKHIRYGCFLLESTTALELNRRPHVRKAELDYLGAIDENGLEEWQPWSGFGEPSPDGRRTPLHALSTFNNILELVDIISSIQNQDTASSHKDATRERLERWRTLLPTQLACLDIESPLPFVTPPLALLQATYHVACFASNPSGLRLNRLSDILDQNLQQLGLQRIPPPIKCLLEFVNRQITYSVLNDANLTRSQKLREKVTTEWPKQQIPNGPQTEESTFMPFRDQRNVLKTANSDPLESIFPDTQSIAQLPADTPNLFFPDSHSTIEPLLMAPSPSKSDTRYPEPINDLESFFDELASLDRATRPDNQPQFMQNLGFGPEASMADLFSEYIPMQSSSFATSDVTPPVHFDQYGFYNGG